MNVTYIVVSVSQMLKQVFFFLMSKHVSLADMEAEVHLCCISKKRYVLSSHV